MKVINKTSAITLILAATLLSGCGDKQEQPETQEIGSIQGRADTETESVTRQALDIRDRGLTLEGDNAILGRAIVVHASLDDLNTDPDGNAGKPVACGVIDSYRPNSNDVSLSG